MLAVVVSELINLCRVTVDAGTLYVREGNVQRHVRVPVAAETALKSEVGLSCLQMAPVAVLNCLSRSRRMSQMAPNARDCPVFSPGGLYIVGRRGMTIYTALFFWFCKGICYIVTNHEHQDTYGQRPYGQVTEALLCCFSPLCMNNPKSPPGYSILSHLTEPNTLIAEVFEIMPQFLSPVNSPAGQNLYRSNRE
jgi:hypothetical protein